MEQLGVAVGVGNELVLGGMSAVAAVLAQLAQGSRATPLHSAQARAAAGL